MGINIKLIAKVLNALINAMEKRCSGFPLDCVIESTTIAVAKEILEGIEKSLIAEETKSPPVEG